MKSTAKRAAAIGIRINKQPRMKPTLTLIFKLQAEGKQDIAKRLMAMRANRRTRYANSSTQSQRQRRKAARRRQIFPVR